KTGSPGYGVYLDCFFIDDVRQYGSWYPKSQSVDRR
ncbi:hypothetical protein GCK32_019233, partial [Trichostrongylus colubriformis]